MCALVKWSNQTIDGSLFLFQKTMWNGIHSKKEHIPERRNHMSWTHQSSHLLESHHSLKHQPWRSCFSSFSSSHTSFCSVLRICFVFSLNMRVFIDFQNYEVWDFLEAPIIFLLHPTIRMKNPKTPLSISYTNWQSVRPLQHRNS